MKHVLTLLAAVALPATAVPQPQTQLVGARPHWVDYFGSPKTDWNNRFFELRDGNVLAAGYVGRDDDNPHESNWDTEVRKYSPDGRLIWTNRFGGPELDSAWAGRELADGSLALAGFSATNSAGGWDASLTLIDREGRVKRDVRFGGPGDDRATDLVVLAGGGFLLVGQSDSSGVGGIDVFLVRTDSTGREIWRRTYGTSTDDRGFLGLPVADGGAFVAGVTGPRGSYDLLLVRIAPDGSEVWRRVVAGTGNDATHGLARLADGQILLAGYGPSWSGRDNNVSVLTFDESGRLLGHHAIGGPGDDRVQFAAADPRGGAWLTGYSKSFSNDWRMLVARVSSVGRIEPWLGAVGGPGEMNGSTVAVAGNGDLLLGGYASPPGGGGGLDAFAMRVAPQAIEPRSDGIEVREIRTACVKIGASEERCS